MKMHSAIVMVPLILYMSAGLYGQSIPLFDEDLPLQIQLEFGRKELLENTNDSTYMPTNFRLSDGEIYAIEGQVRSRGNFRKQNCYYIPLKIKVRPDAVKGSPLEGTSKFKLVLPCKLEKGNDDATVKEFIAYKIYEQLMPYHFKTRLLDIQWKNTDGKRPKMFSARGFILEDIDEMAARYGTPEIKRRILAMQQDDTTSVGVAYFEYLIANTDFSTRMRHNIKLIYKDGRILPVPFDFDLSGLVNASYAEVTNVQYLSKRIYEVTDRAYKGYLRDARVMQYMRRHFIERKDPVMATITEYGRYLENKRDIKTMQVFLSEFYKVFEDEKKFERLILRHARH